MCFQHVVPQESDYRWDRAALLMDHVKARMKRDSAMRISTTRAAPYRSSGRLVTKPTPSFISEHCVWRVTLRCAMPIRRAGEIRLPVCTKQHMTHAVSHTTFVPT